MKRIMLSAAALLATTFLVAACDEDDPGDPGTTTFNVVLTKAAEIYTPACTNPGATAAGTATVVINSDNDEIHITDLNFTGLSGPISGAHFHFGASTVPLGPIVINIGNITTGFDGDFDEDDYIAAAGAPATFAAFITAMKNDQSYINLHTNNCGNGEIRGQLITP